MKLTKSFRELKKESGSFITDELGSLLVMMFILAMMLACIAYAKMVQIRLSVDNIAKEYLYQMEQEGYLSQEMRNFMIEDLENIGVDKETISFTGTSHMDANQAAYGERINLVCSVTFDNPLFEFLSEEVKGSAENLMFTIPGLSPTITYKVDMPATAKW